MRRIAFLALLAACHTATLDSTAPRAALTAEPAPALVSTAPAAVLTSFPLPEAPKGTACAMTRLESIEKGLLSAKAPEGPPVQSARWDRASAPARLDRVKERFGLTAGELEVLGREGFVVPDRLSYDGYTVAFHEVYQSELPVYVSVDPILHTVFVAHDELVERLERERVIPLLEHLIGAMVHELPHRAAVYAPDVAADVDVYLMVARSLLSGSPVKNAEAKRLLDLANRADGLTEVTLFGRPRLIDFSQYKPRGHYAKSVQLGRFFRGAMWLSRLEFNLVSRSSRSSQPGVTPNPEETPREATVALALADLASHAGVLGEIDAIDRAWGALAGKREDVPIAELFRIEQAGAMKLTPEDAFPVLKSAVGDRYKRTARLYAMPEGSTELPAIATMLGPRVVDDAAAARLLVHGDVPDRYDLTISDVVYALGHDRAKRYLATDLGRFPGLSVALDKARSQLAFPGTQGDVYGSWLAVVRALSEKPHGTIPTFMTTEGWQDLRVNSTVAAYAQIKHDYVLIAGQPYEEGACEVPDGFVDPALGVWDALVAYAEESAAAFRRIDPRDGVGAQAYFARLGNIVRILRRIAIDELSGRPLSPSALAFLSMIVEVHAEDIGTGYSTTYNGWYFDLFLSRPAPTTEPPPGRSEEPAMKYAGFIADYSTSSNTGLVAYAGATAPRLGVFVVDTGGPPRVVVGPVASAFELHAPLVSRLTDAQVKKGLHGQATSPWTASYTVGSSAEPPLAVSVVGGDGETMRVELRSTRSLGPATVTLLDHHRRPVASKTMDVGAARSIFAFPPRPQQKVLSGTHATEMVQIQIGDFEAFIDLIATTDLRQRGYGGMRAPP